MPLALLGAMAAISLYAAACSFVIALVLVPGLPYAIAAGAVIGLLVTVVVLVGTLLGAYRFAVATVTSRHVLERLPKRKGTAFPRDDAWPNYLFAQGRDDLRAAFGRSIEVMTTTWVTAGRAVRDNRAVLVLWPLLLLPLAAMVAGSATLLGSLAVLGVLLGAVLLLALLGWLVMTLALRGIDHGVRRLRRAQATCHYPGCNDRAMLPAFRCPCGEVHHDIRAGRQGALFRRCSCDRLLPTTVLRASAGMVAMCQRCNRPLHDGAAVLTDVVVPVFGPTSAGKTRFVYAGMVALAGHLQAVGATLRPVGPENAATLTAATRIVETGRQTTKTAVDPPAALTVTIASSRRTALLHLFDAAGEFFADRSKAAELPYLADPQGLVFVLDPFSIPAVVNELRADPAALDEAQPAQLDPEQSYLVTTQWLADQRVALGRMPLAVAVVKADLLLGLQPGTGLSPDSSSEDVERWLHEKGVDNLTEGAKRDFGVVRFFLVSSLDDISSPDGRASATSPARPLLWLLASTGLPVSDQQDRVAS